MKQERIEPTANQQKYLALLLSRAHAQGVPYLPIEALSKSQVSAWIDYLKTVVEVEAGAKSSSSSFLPISPRTNGYRPALGGSNHQHEIEPWQTEDGWEILECVVCGARRRNDRRSARGSAARRSSGARWQPPPRPHRP